MEALEKKKNEVFQEWCSKGIHGDFGGYPKENYEFSEAIPGRIFQGISEGIESNFFISPEWNSCKNFWKIPERFLTGIHGAVSEVIHGRSIVCGGISQKFLRTH